MYAYEMNIILISVFYTNETLVFKKKLHGTINDVIWNSLQTHIFLNIIVGAVFGFSSKKRGEPT